MSITETILKNYRTESLGIKKNLVNLFHQGELSGTGRLMIYPIDQGFEHGPIKSFSKNPEGFDPDYHLKLALEGGFSAFAAPYGLLAAGNEAYTSRIPLILKMNSANQLVSGNIYNQAITSSVDDAVRLGCMGIGFTLYSGSNDSYEMFEEIQMLSEEARAKGLLVIIWSYPRGNLSKEGETAIDVISYGVHMSCLLGAHIVKAKLPTNHIEVPEMLPHMKNFPHDSMTDRVRLVVKSAFNGKRFVIFSGGGHKGDEALLDDVRAIRDGGGHGSIVGRNVFQRPWNEALAIVKKMNNLYKK